MLCWQLAEKNIYIFHFYFYNYFYYYINYNNPAVNGKTI